MSIIIRHNDVRSWFASPVVHLSATQPHDVGNGHFTNSIDCIVSLSVSAFSLKDKYYYNDLVAAPTTRECPSSVFCPTERFITKSTHYQ